MKKISTSTLQRPMVICLQRPMVICLLAAFCCLLWGSAFPAVKIGYGLLSISSADSAEQLIFAGLRFFFAGVVTVLFHSASLRRLRLPARSSLWKATKLGLIQTLVQYALFYIGMAHTSGVKGSVLMAVHVFFAILISAKLFHYERLNAPKLLGCLCGFGGVLLINLSGGGLGGGFTLLKLQELLLYLEGLESGGRELTRYGSQQTARIQEIHALLTEHLDRRYTIEELSHRYLLNTSTLKEVFKAVYGLPIATYMKEYRVRRAMELLRESGGSIAAIAAAVGYESQGKFTRAFKDVTGQLPTEYRREHRG